MSNQNNKDRTRKYGKRKGDTISYSPFGTRERIGEVTNIDLFDNNSILVLFEGNTKPIKVVSEWCKVITKIEDKTNEQ